MTNFFGHYIIVTKLLGVLKNSDKPRVVNISSVYSNFSNGNPDIIFQRKNNYALSKLAMVYLTKKISIKELGNCLIMFSISLFFNRSAWIKFF